MDKAEFARNFVGLKVKWTLKFASIYSRSNGTLKIRFFSDSFRSVKSEVSVNEYPFFKYISKGYPVTIYGEILGIDPVTVNLKIDRIEPVPRSFKLAMP